MIEKPRPTSVTVSDVVPPDDDLRQWLEGQLLPDRQFLLAHFDDGVVWGQLDPSGGLVTSNDLANDLSPALRLSTLQQAFVFGENGEVRIWRGELDGFESRLIVDSVKDDENEESPNSSFVEDQILWGTELIECEDCTKAGFSRLRERRQKGLEHVMPLLLEANDGDDRARPFVWIDSKSGERVAGVPRLRVRHFIDHDPKTGAARISLSRLVKVFVS